MGHPAPERALSETVLVPTPYPDAADLVAELDADLLARYGEGEPVAAHPEQFTAGRRGGFLVAWTEGVATGCAGFRAIGPATAELKRMWVRPAYRGRGLARALLLAVEDAARAAGHRELWLETGTGQPEAISLYTSAGYTPVPAFGQYAEAPDARHLGRHL